MTARVQVVDKDGTRYVIVSGKIPGGDSFVAVPNLGAAAIMTPHPVESGYFQTKLGIGEADARAIFEALNPGVVDV